MNFLININTPIERLVEVKKLLFIRSVMVLDQNDLMSTYASGKFYVRELFFSQHMDEFKLNPYRSPMFDLIKTSCKFD